MHQVGVEAVAKPEKPDYDRSQKEYYQKKVSGRSLSRTALFRFIWELFTDEGWPSRLDPMNGIVACVRQMWRMSPFDGTVGSETTKRVSSTEASASRLSPAEPNRGIGGRLATDTDLPLVPRYGLPLFRRRG